MKLGTKAKTLLLCSVFAIATVGCDKLKSGNDNKAPAPAPVAATQPVAAQPAPPPPPVAAPAPVKEEPKPDERTFSNGEREGHVTKLSFKSSPVPKYMEGDNLETCKNWEGELSMENTVTNNAVGANGVSTGGNSFAFSIGKNRKDIVTKVRNALHNQHRVSLQYNQLVRHDECKSRTDYLIVGVVDLEPNKDKPAPVIIQQVQPPAPAPRQ